MTEIDRRAREEYGISQNTLMENAGRSAAEVILNDNPVIAKENIAILCGKGNNGGDGFVIVRRLSERSPKRLTVYATDPSNIRPGAALDNFNAILKMGLDIRDIKEFKGSSEDFTMIIDGIFGTGFRGELPGFCASIFKDINTSSIKTYAIDVPSGLNATTGEASKNCFKARKTVTFGLPKQGFYLKDGPAVCGEIVVKDIGFPKELLSS